MQTRIRNVNNNQDIIDITDAEMPEWFNPIRHLYCYYSKNGTCLELCDCDWYEDDLDNLTLAKEILHSFWWLEITSIEYHQLVNRMSAAGIGLRVFKDFETAEKYKIWR